MTKSIFNNKVLTKEEIIYNFKKHFNDTIPTDKISVSDFYLQALKSKNINNLLALQELNIIPQNSNITAYDFVLSVIKYNDNKKFFSLYKELGIFEEDYITKDLNRSNCIISSLLSLNKKDILNNLLEANYPKKIFINSHYIYYILHHKDENAAKELLNKNIEIPFSLMESAFMWSMAKTKNIQQHYNIIEMFLDNMLNNKKIDPFKFNQLKTTAYLSLLNSETLSEKLLNQFLNKYKPGVYDSFYFQFMDKEVHLNKKIAESEETLNYFLKNNISDFSTEYLEEISNSIAYHALNNDSEENIYHILKQSLNFNIKTFLEKETTDSNSLIKNAFIQNNNNTYNLLFKNGLSINYSEQQYLFDKTFDYFGHMYRYPNGKKIMKSHESFIINHIIGDSSFEINHSNINVEISDKERAFPINFLQLALETKNKNILISLKNQERFNFESSMTEYIFNKINEYKLNGTFQPNNFLNQFSEELTGRLNLISKIFKIDIKDVVMNNIPNIAYSKINKEDFSTLLKIAIDRKCLNEILKKKAHSIKPAFNKGRL